MTVEAISPIAGRSEDLARVAERSGGDVELRHLPFLAQFGLRVGSADVVRAPYPLPLEPNTVWEDGARAVMWLGPDEWLVMGPPTAGPVIVAELDAAFGSTARSIVDLSANRVTLDISGPRSREVLSKGCSLDLDPRGGWHAGRCAQTLLAHVPVILHERAESTRVLVRPSFADWLVDWIIAAAAPAATS